MLPELGHLFLIAGVTTSFITCFLGAAAYMTPFPALHLFFRPLVRICAVMTFFLILISTLFLAHAFVVNDFSVLYVAQHANTALPLGFKIAALWGGHEGSFLFMLLALSAWSALLALTGKALPAPFKTAALFVLSAIVVLFGIYCLWLSNPFLRQSPVPLDGRDLNPMLQDIGLIFHPPLLYLGYIGFAVPFAFAASSLITNTPASTWTPHCRPWTAGAWGLLTGGIALGAWWAYKELGWGGWWFWDPVENASLLPWLTGTALMHCLIANQRENQLVRLSVLLCLFTFSLSLLGTFIVRSGVLTSVHGFASDPSRGRGLLAILAFTLLPALLLFAYKAPRMSFYEHSLDKKETMPLNSLSFLLLCGAALLVLMAFIVLLGTFYPLIYSAFGQGTLSVGAPYFNSLFVPLALIGALLGAWGSFLISRPVLLKTTTVLALCSGGILSSAALTFFFSTLYAQAFSFNVMLAITASILLIFGAFRGLTQSARLALRFGHTGLALVITASAVLSQYSDEISVKMQKDETVNLGPYVLVHQGNSWHIGPNYTSERVTFSVLKNGVHKSAVSPEKRHYTARGTQMSEVGIWQDALSDVYVTLGNKFDQHAFAVRVQFKPLIHLLWAGGGLMMLSGFISAGGVLARRKKRGFHVSQRAELRPYRKMPQ